MGVPLYWKAAARVAVHLNIELANYFMRASEPAIRNTALAVSLSHLLCH
jgi:hypothetical protein